MLTEIRIRWVGNGLWPVRYYAIDTDQQFTVGGDLGAKIVFLDGIERETLSHIACKLTDINVPTPPWRASLSCGKS